MFPPLNRFFRRPKQDSSPPTPLDELEKTRAMFEEKIRILENKKQAEVENAKQLLRASNTAAASRCIKRKVLYEEQVSLLTGYQQNIMIQIVRLGSEIDTAEMINAVRIAESARKAVQKEINIDDVGKTIDEIKKQTENMKQIQEALSTPVGAAAGS